MPKIKKHKTQETLTYKETLKTNNFNILQKMETEENL